ncbi:MAG: FAD-dependent oxidoreductase [Lentisphaeria bacterium]
MKTCFNRTLAATVLASSLAGCRLPGPRTHEADIVVYGGTSAGVVAAVQAAKMGKTVILVGPDRHLGGLSSGGLGYTDSGNTKAVGGLAREFYERIYAYYGKTSAWRWQRMDAFRNEGQGSRSRVDAERAMWTFEPHVAESIFDAWIVEHRVPVYRDEWLDREKGVVVRDGRIVAITMLSGKTFVGEVFIDATYEGDLMAAAGVSYTVGREANGVYGERWNGVQLEGIKHHRHCFMSPVSPYKVPGDPTSGLLPYVSAEPPGGDGEGDRRVQAYCYRTCLTRHAPNRVPFPKPEGYDPANYELLLRDLLTGRKDFFEKFDLIPNLKTDTNNHGAFSSDFIGMNYDYPDASYARRREILKAHANYQKGLYYFVANDPRVPAAIREEMAQWGLAADEFKDNGHWPHQIYVREARRMIGRHVMTERDTLNETVVADPVGMGSYTLDSHNVQRYVTPGGFVQNEGDIGVRTKGPYKISYGSIVPRKSECRNLLVPVCLSSSHIAYGSIRMEPVFMILGQSAATAAAFAVEDGAAVQDVDYAKLRERLMADKQRL